MLLTVIYFDKQVEMGGCKGPITTFIVEPFIPHKEEFYLNIVSDRLGNSISYLAKVVSLYLFRAFGFTSCC